MAMDPTQLMQGGGMPMPGVGAQAPLPPQAMAESGPTATLPAAHKKRKRRKGGGKQMTRRGRKHKR